MDKPITITGEDIIGWDGTDKTGALKELGVSLPKSKKQWNEIMQETFQVDLDFILRHNLMRPGEIYDKHYKGSPQFMRYYDEGRAAYLAGAEENPPHQNTFTQCYPWYAGYRETQAVAMEAKYHLAAFQAEVRAVIAKYGLSVEDCDEYPGSYSYAKTPEGYFVKLT